jgi:Tol biopolymer transport system component
MKRHILFVFLLFSVVSLAVCGGTEIASSPTAFESAAAAAKGSEQGADLRRIWPGVIGNLDFRCGGPSPDGKLFSFVDWATGDLAAYDIETGETRHLTDKGSWNENGSWNECSIFSPDGTQVVFNYGNAQGTNGFAYELRVLDLSDPVESQKVLLRLPEDWGWTAPADWQGDEILALTCVTEESFRLVALNVADDTERVILESDDGLPYPAKFSPDGQTIAYQLGSEIRLIGRDGSGDRSSGLPGGSLIGWAPTGELLYHVSSAREVRSVSVGKSQGSPEPVVVKGDLTSAFPIGMAGGTLYYGVAVEAVSVHTATIDWENGRVSTPLPVASTIEGMSVFPDWSPDGRTLAYIHRPMASRQEPSLMLRSTQGDEVRELTKLDMDNANSLAWSPDGSSIWFQANGETAPALYRVDVRTGDISNVLEGIGRNIAVGPGGKIYFSRRAATGVEPGMYEYQPDNGDFRKLVDDDSLMGNYNIGVSRDGSKLAYSRFDKEQEVHELVVVPIGGGEPRVILQIPAPDYITPIAHTMVWSPDDRWIIYRHRSEAGATLEMVTVDGSEKKVIVLIENEAPGHVKLHPDGRRLAIVAGDNMNELWTMSLEGSGE